MSALAAAANGSRSAPQVMLEDRAPQDRVDRADSAHDRLDPRGRETDRHEALAQAGEREVVEGREAGDVGQGQGGDSLRACSPERGRASNAPTDAALRRR
jgi:hypothetical protein